MNGPVKRQQIKATEPGGKASFENFLESYMSKKNWEPWIEERPQYKEYISTLDPSAANVWPEGKRKQERQSIYDIWAGSGKPFIKQQPRDEWVEAGGQKGPITIRDEGGEEFRGPYKRGHYPSPEPRAHFKFGERNLYDLLGASDMARTVSPDTAVIRSGNLSEFFAEAAHAEQFKGEASPREFAHESFAARAKHGEKVYDVKYLEELEGKKGETKSMEYEAHSEIQPKMESKYISEIFGK